MSGRKGDAAVKNMELMNCSMDNHYSQPEALPSHSISVMDSCMYPPTLIEY